MRGYLLLQDGNLFAGEMLQSEKSKNKTCYGEVVFNTGMTGYQEILTDPSYTGQIIVMTYPLIGNYGICSEYMESNKVNASGFITSEISSLSSNYTSEGDLKSYLLQNNIPTLTGVDTRKLVKHVRETGTINGLIFSEKEFNEYGSLNSDELFLKLKDTVKQTVDFKEVVKSVSTKEIFSVGEGERNIVLLDFGCKSNIINSLNKRNCKVTVVPYDTNADKIMQLNPDGILLSNGPGDPKDVINEVKDTILNLSSKIPTLGICLGHQLLALSYDCDTFKLKYGHRGCNHPVKELKNNKVYITSQNHGYSVKADNIPDNIIVTHINLNDGTVEGIRHKKYKAFSIQYHPEACPGPNDSNYIFNEFLEVIENGK